MIVVDCLFGLIGLDTAVFVYCFIALCCVCLLFLFVCCCRCVVVCVLFQVVLVSLLLFACYFLLCLFVIVVSYGVYYKERLAICIVCSFIVLCMFAESHQPSNNTKIR